MPRIVVSVVSDALCLALISVPTLVLQFEGSGVRILCSIKFVVRPGLMNGNLHVARLLRSLLGNIKFQMPI